MPRLIPALLIGLFLGPAAAELRAEQVMVQVNTAEALQTAISTASPGTVITLAAGDYGRFDLRSMVMPPDQPLVLRGPDGEGEARITGLLLRGVENLVLENLVFDYSFTPGDPGYLRPFQINGSRGITIRASVFDGDVAQGLGPDSDGFGTAFGLSLRGSTGITLEDSEIRGFFRGLVVSESTDILVRGNDIHDLRMDGMNFSQVERVRIEDNHIHDFTRSLDSGDHSDMIQFWTNGTTAPSRDIVISNNVLNSGDGWYTQSIFMRNDQVDRGLAGPEMFYRDVLITQNVIINAHLHGIAVGETDGLTISNNTVIRNVRSEGEDDNPPLWNPRISVGPASRRVQILRNVVSRIAGYETQGDWDVTDNLLIQDAGRLGSGAFYDAVFANARSGNPQDLASFAYKPGGPLEGAGLGADRLAAPVPVVPGRP